MHNAHKDWQQPQQPCAHLFGSVERANSVGTALNGGMTPPRSTASITSSALRRTWNTTVNRLMSSELHERAYSLTEIGKLCSNGPKAEAAYPVQYAQ